MNKVLSTPQSRLKEISTKLKSFDCKQSSLVLIEALFFEALSISRNYPQELSKSTLFSDLIRLKENEYKRTQEYCKTIGTKETSIRHFRFYLKKVLDKAISA